MKSLHKYILVILALAGFIAAVVMGFFSSRPMPVDSASLPGFNAPFAAYVAGPGMVEASSGNIAVGTSVDGIVKAIYVNVGDRVEQGQALFMIDDSELQAQRIATVARVREAEANLRKPTDKLATAERLYKMDSRAISQQQLIELRDDVEVATAALASARAELQSLERRIELCTVHAPIAGSILQLRLRVGEYAEAGGNGSPLLILGDDSTLHVRVDINENDAWRIDKAARAVAYLRGNADVAIPLAFVRVEPYAVPKQDLTGQSTERTDVRVVQVIYRLEQQEVPVYIGQQLDVYIETPVTNP